jgi:hypothetical protein
MAINPNTASTLIWQAEDVNDTVQDIFTTPYHVQKVILNNNDNAARYVQFFNVAAATVVLGTTEGVWFKVPANGALILGKDSGVFYNGEYLSVAATTTATGAVSVTNNMQVTVFYAK